MSPGRPGSRTNVAWRPPYLAAAGMLVVAILLDAWTGNLLWLWYSGLGLAGIVALAILHRRGAWRVPDRLLWWAAVPLAMHYLGGSLSGTHRIGGPNGLYWVLPWWDNVVHFLGAGAIAVVAAHLLSTRRRGTRILLATACATTIGVLVELYEFLHFAWLGTIDQGFYTNTMLDLYYNGLGAVAFAWAYTRQGPPSRHAALVPAAVWEPRGP